MISQFPESAKMLLMDTETVFAVLNIFGLFVFAVSGALTALRNDLDILSVAMTAFVTGVGGERFGTSCSTSFLFGGSATQRP